MIKNKILLLLTLGIILSGCRTDETLCEAADCIAPVVTLKIKLLDKANNKNLLNNNTSFSQRYTQGESTDIDEVWYEMGS